MTNTLKKPDQGRRFKARILIDMLLYWTLFFVCWDMLGVRAAVTSYTNVAFKDLNARLYLLSASDIDVFLALFILFPVFWILIEGLLLSTVGTTAGKYLLNIQVRTRNGEKLSFLQGILRASGVWTIGLAAGIPFLVFAWFPIGISFGILVGALSVGIQSKVYARSGYTTWDRLGGFEVTVNQNKENSSLYKDVATNPTKQVVMLPIALIYAFLLFALWLGLGWSGVFSPRRSASEIRDLDNIAIGNQAYRSGDLRAAIDSYTKVIANTPHDIHVEDNTDNYIAPDGFAAYQLRATAYWSLKEYEKSLSDLKEIARIQPGNASNYTKLGDAYSTLGRRQEASLYYDQALKIEKRKKDTALPRQEIREKVSRFKSLHL